MTVFHVPYYGLDCLTCAMFARQGTWSPPAQTKKLKLNHPCAILWVGFVLRWSYVQANKAHFNLKIARQGTWIARRSGLIQTRHLSNRLLQILDLYRRSPESGDLRYKSRQLQNTIWYKRHLKREAVLGKRSRRAQVDTVGAVWNRMGCNLDTCSARRCSDL